MAPPPVPGWAQPCPFVKMENDWQVALPAHQRAMRGTHALWLPAHSPCCSCRGGTAQLGLLCAGGVASPMQWPAKSVYPGGAPGQLPSAVTKVVTESIKEASSAREVTPDEGKDWRNLVAQ